MSTPSAVQRLCRGCKKVRPLPIEGPCPHCRGYYRTVKKRVRGEEDDVFLPEGPIPVGDLLALPDSAPSAERHKTGLSGVDYVFGGGVPTVGTVLFCAREGVGKTTWLFELFLHLRLRSLLLSTEQSREDLIREFARLGADRIRRASRYMAVESETDLDRIVEIIEAHRPELFALDSLHDVEGVCDAQGKLLASSSDRAVTRVAKVIGRLCRPLRTFGFLVGHMSNDGTMMGGSHLRHAVNGVLGLYCMSEDENDPRRLLRFHRKCRFAKLGRKALFKMSEHGLEDCGPLRKKGDRDPGPPDKTPRLRLVE